MRYSILLFLGLMLCCSPKKKYHDSDAQNIPLSTTDAIADIFAFQSKTNEDFKDPEKSPLPDRYRKDFESLDFFPPDTTFVVTAKLQFTPNAIPFEMPTTTGRISKETLYAVAHFEINGEPQKLEIYQNKELMLEEGFEDYLFLPFTDKTNGESTYEGGRYIDLRLPKSDSIVINFNKAYNPYCVYNKKYSCPIVPSVNDLKVLVEAGMKSFEPNKK